MRLGLPTAGLERYESGSQRARVATEGWAERNLYCPNCDSNRLARFAPNTPALDFVCPRCRSLFQLKSQRRPFGARISDAAYEKMIRAVLQDTAPNLFALHYRPDSWRVWYLFVVPRFALSRSVIEERKPLGPGAERAGWVGCNILLSRIPSDARIPIVVDGVAASPAAVRNRYALLRPLGRAEPEKRGWTLDVLNGLRSLNRAEFSLSEAYALEGELARLHCKNRHIRDKIRQQLQLLRDMRIVEFLGRGRYRLR
jgi:type II restriction enzyme